MIKVIQYHVLIIIVNMKLVGKSMQFTVEHNNILLISNYLFIKVYKLKTYIYNGFIDVQVKKRLLYVVWRSWLQYSINNLALVYVYHYLISIKINLNSIRFT